MASKGTRYKVEQIVRNLKEMLATNVEPDAKKS
jgi:hypothetical protein